jgi:superfamily II helicase
VEKSKRLIPYSVYLSEETHEALREKARSRQASKVVRDAITMILEGGDQFSSGYKQGLRDAMNVIMRDESASMVSINDKKIADNLIDQLELLVDQA